MNPAPAMNALRAALDSAGLRDPLGPGSGGPVLAAITVTTAPVGARPDSALARPRMVVTIEFLRN